MFELQLCEPKSEVLPGATPAEILQVRMPDVLGDYDTPQDCPEWRWVAEKSCFSHRGNGIEPGVWEFVINTSSDLQEIPEKLIPYIQRAKETNCAYIVFFQ